MSSSPQIRRRPGRPRAGEGPDARQALIQAARELFSRHGFDQVSSRRLAAEADLNPAMIHYYFDGKLGLLEAAFREAIGPVIKELSTLSEQPDADERSVRRFLELYMRTLAANPWLPRLFVREVLPDGGRLRPLVIGEMRNRVAPALLKLVGHAQARGELRQNLDPLLTLLSLVGAAVFPFLSLPITSRAFGLDMSTPFVERLIDHTAELFYSGAGGKAGA